jgi:glycosyltransferase involved in cell wall biosynthesis
MVVVKNLLIEGWRTSPHSYAMVNQHQLLHLLDDQRFSIRHRDIPFYQPHWAGIDSGFPSEEKARLASIPGAPDGPWADLTYRISYPIRVDPGQGRVFVFTTREFGGNSPQDSVDSDSHKDPGQPNAVEFITPSNWSRDALLAGGMAPGRVHVIPHGVDPSLAQRLPASGRAIVRGLLGIPEDAFVFLNVGAMTWNKGIGPLIAAFAVHRRQYPRSMLVLKGGDVLYGAKAGEALNEARQLRVEAKDSDLLDSIRYISENLSVSDLATLYGASDAYISPYRAEGFNLPVLEAMVAGLPVLVTAGGPTDDFCPPDFSITITADLQQSQKGEFLEPRIQSTIEAMQRVADDPMLRERLSWAVSQWAVDQFSWEKVTARLADLLHGPP